MNTLKSTTSSIMSSMSTAYVALGSNLGDRGLALTQALKLMSETVGKLSCTSYLYESKPMYHTDQPPFINAACQLETRLSPSDLLSGLKDIEKKMGRQETFRNGPRKIDLDIIMYGSQHVSTPNLEIPHPRMVERSFVLRPLCDVASSAMHPTLQQSILSLYDGLDLRSKSELRRIIPCYNHQRKATRYLSLEEQFPIIMGIVNVTPDSFSDGGLYSSSLEATVAQARKLIAEGAQILDIGGESTRPGAATVSSQEEINRVVPVIQAIRSAGLDTLISVDTRKAAVAEAAIEAGGDIINDVSGGVYDPDMIPLVAKLQVPYIAMHMRGDPSTMIDKRFSTYSNALEEVTAELKTRLDLIDSSVPRWLQIADPGIGFAKGYKENNDLLKPANLKTFKVALGNRPLLVGLSRKRFLNKINETSQDLNVKVVSSFEGEETFISKSVNYPLSLEDRDLLTAGAHCAALMGGADIVRTHNVAFSRKVIDSFQHITHSHSDY